MYRSTLINGLLIYSSHLLSLIYMLYSTRLLYSIHLLYSVLVVSASRLHDPDVKTPGICSLWCTCSLNFNCVLYSVWGLSMKCLSPGLGWANGAGGSMSALFKIPGCTASIFRISSGSILCFDWSKVREKRGEVVFWV